MEPLSLEGMKVILPILSNSLVFSLFVWLWVSYPLVRWLHKFWRVFFVMISKNL